MKLNEVGGICYLHERDCIQILQGELEGERPLEDLQLGERMILTLRSLTLYIYGAPILDVSRSHTTTQHSR